MARDQRTRLNAELAHQYNGSTRRGAGKVTPGRSSLTEDLVEPAEADVEAEVDEQQEAEVAQAEAPERESKKSLFELPRKEPSRQPLLPGVSAAAPPAAPAGPAKPDSKPRGGGRR